MQKENKKCWNTSPKILRPYINVLWYILGLCSTLWHPITEHSDNSSMSIFFSELHTTNILGTLMKCGVSSILQHAVYYFGMSFTYCESQYRISWFVLEIITRSVFDEQFNNIFVTIKCRQVQRSTAVIIKYSPIQLCRPKSIRNSIFLSYIPILPIMT